MNKKYIILAMFSAVAMGSQAALIMDLKLNTGIVTNGSGFVSQWTDQSGLGNHALSNGGTTEVTAQGALTFTGNTGTTADRMKVGDATFNNNLLNFSATPGTGGFSALISFKDDVGVTSNTWYDVFGNSSAVASGFFIRTGGAVGDDLGDLVFNLGSGESVSSVGNAVPDGSTLKVGITYDNATGGFVFKYMVNAGLMQTVTGTTSQNQNFDNATDLQLGYNSNNSRPFAGNIGALQIYNHAMSSVDLGTALNAMPATIPEPATLSLVALFGGALLLVRRFVI